MTRKDYVLIAKALADTRPNPLLAEAREAWKQVRDKLCTLLANDNSRFDTERFIDATEK